MKFMYQIVLVYVMAVHKNKIVGKIVQHVMHIQLP